MTPPLGLPAGHKAEAVVHVLGTHAANVAWQAGLLLAVAALLAATSGRWPSSAQ